MRATTRLCRRLTLASALLALAVLASACGSRSSSGQQDAGPADGWPTDAGAVDSGGDAAPQDAAPRDTAPIIVSAWIARDFATGYGSDPAVSQALGLILRQNAAGTPADGLLIWLLRIEPTSDAQARLSWGLGELVDPANNLYRFRSDHPPVVVTGTNTLLATDAGPPPQEYKVSKVDVPFEMPVAPTSGAKPASVLSILPGYDVLVAWSPGSTWPEFHVDSAQVSQQAACSVWINDVNLLDDLDDDPTMNLHGSLTGSVDFQTCACQCSTGETFRMLFQITNLGAVNLLVDQ
jgi:hypothetical protein